MPEVEIWNPSPLPRAHLTPAVDDAQVNGPSVTHCPCCSVGVPTPAFARHCWPLHSANELSVLSVTDAGGENVRQKVDVIAVDPKPLSISQLMFFEGEKFGRGLRLRLQRPRCGGRRLPWRRSRSSVPAVVDVAAALVVEVVVAGGADPLEHAANHSALTATSARSARRRAHRDACMPQRVGRTPRA